MRLETPFIALMIASLFFTGIYTIYITVGETYESQFDLSIMTTENGTSVYEAFNKINETKTKMDQTNKEFEDTLLTNNNDLYSFYKLGKKIGTNIYYSLTTLKDIMVNITEILGIPPYVIVVFFSILVTSFALLVIYFILGRSAWR